MRSQRVSSVVVGLLLFGTQACTRSTTHDSPSPPSNSIGACAFELASSPSVRSGILRGVTAISATDAWAVGGLQKRGQGSRALIEHWDGAQWSLVSGPNTDKGSLNAISAISSDDVWAVGSSGGFQGGSLIEHWDGTAWSIVQSPHIDGADYLTSVSVDASTDAWAVGAHWVGGITGAGHYTTLIEHWNGVRWEIVDSPDVFDGSSSTSPSFSVLSTTDSPPTTYSVEVGDNILGSVNARSPDDVWAVGHSFRSGSYRPVAEHWNGRAWTVKNPEGTGDLVSVLAPAEGSVWSFGNSALFAGGRSSIPRPFVDSWDGSGWQRATLSVDRRPAIIAASAAEGTNVWAVGQIQGPDDRALVEHWDGQAWAMIAVPAAHTALDGLAVASGWVVAVGEDTRLPSQPVIVQSC
jgi:hypothetical protein